VRIIVTQRQRHLRLVLADEWVHLANLRHTRALSRGCGLIQLCEAPVTAMDGMSPHQKPQLQNGRRNTQHSTH
jgi:hypothetical protein